MIHKVVGYYRVSTGRQDYQRQIESLQSEADKKGWVIQRNFAEKISGTTKTSDRKVFEEMINYISVNQIQIVMISEISRLGRKVINILEAAQRLHEMDVAIYVQQFGMTSLNDDGSENSTFKLLLHMMSLGAEMENDLRKQRQKEGIALTKLRHPERYSGRKKGAKADKDSILKKYSNVVDLLSESNLSLRKIAKITGHSVNTVRKVKSLI